jgi:hypothetical protein
MADISPNFLIKASKTLASDTSWFDGSSSSIYDRLEKVQEMIDSLKTAASHSQVGEGELTSFANQISLLEADRDQLQKTASEYVDFDTEEYLQNLPGGTVASQYHKYTNDGMFDLGEDDGSFLYQAAKEVQEEYRDHDWANFVTAGAESWTFEQSQDLVLSQLATREAACKFVEKKTAGLLDVSFRASIIDNFLDNVEVCRREKTAGTKRQARKNKVFTARKELTESYTFDNALGDKYNWL